MLYQKQNPIYTTKTIRRIFQGIRIEVNEELSEIKSALEGIKNHIKSNGAINLYFLSLSGG